LRTEQFGVRRGKFTLGHTVEQGLGLNRREVGGLRGGVAVVGAGRAMGGEKGAALAVRGQIAGPCQAILAGDFAETFQIIAETFEFGSTTGSGR
jgi:hypothetical protein